LTFLGSHFLCGKRTGETDLRAEQRDASVDLYGPTEDTTYSTYALIAKKTTGGFRSAVALVHEGEQLSYAELNGRANGGWLCLPRASIR
jgi:hypothetical protein